jgi:hypothetical protein
MVAGKNPGLVNWLRFSPILTECGDGDAVQSHSGTFFSGGVLFWNFEARLPAGG